MFTVTRIVDAGAANLLAADTLEAISQLVASLCVCVCVSVSVSVSLCLCLCASPRCWFVVLIWACAGVSLV